MPLENIEVLDIAFLEDLFYQSNAMGGNTKSIIKCIWDGIGSLVSVINLASVWGQAVLWMSPLQGSGVWITGWYDK